MLLLPEEEEDPDPLDDDDPDDDDEAAGGASADEDAIATCFNAPYEDVLITPVRRTIPSGHGDRPCILRLSN